MKRIKQDTFHQYQFLSNLNNNDAETLAFFIKTKINNKKDDYDQDLYCYDGKKTECWMKDVKYYAFDEEDTVLIKDHNRTKKQVGKGYEITVFNRVSISSKQIINSIELPLNASSIRRLSEGLYLIIATTSLDYPDYYKASKSEQRKIIKERQDNNDYQVIDEYPFFYNGAGYINKTRTSLFIFREINGELIKITPTLMDVESLDVCFPKIAFAAFEFSTFKDKWAKIYEYDLTNASLVEAYPKKDFQVQRVFYSLSQLMCAGTFGKSFGMMENSKFYLIQDNQLVEYLDNDTSLYPSVGSDCRYGSSKNYFNREGIPYFITTVKGNTHLIRICNGQIEKIIEKKGSLDDVCFLGGEPLCIALYQMKLQELYQFNAGRYEVVSTFNDLIRQEYFISCPIKHNVENDDVDIEGWVLLPYGYDASKTYPSILDIHGGPKTAYGAVFYHEMQYWASVGYIVYFLNPRGSDGKGNAFADLRRNMGKIDYQDIMKFTDSVQKTYPLDPTRMAVTGGSYGGYMTNWIIGHTDRFACAASQRSISNWISMVLASDYGIDFPIEQEFDDLHHCHDELWEASPLKYADNINTPTLFIHSYEDYRCPIQEALQLYTAMITRGVSARICAFKHENHELSRSGKPSHRSRRLKEITEWINKYTKEGKPNGI